MARWVSRRLVRASCLMAWLAFGAVTSAQANPPPAVSSPYLPLPTPIPSPSLPLPTPIPSPSLPLPTPIPSPYVPLPTPIPSPSLLTVPSPAPSSSPPTLASPDPSLLNSPLAPGNSNGPETADQAAPESGQLPLFPRAASRGPDPAAAPMAPSKSAGQASAPSSQTDQTGSRTVCPILGVGGNGCQGLPQWIIQQLAETGYGGFLALVTGLILSLVGVGGLILHRRRGQLLS